MEHAITLNHILVLNFPDGFHVMSQEERGKLNFIENGPGECLSDPGRHMIISAGWRPLGRLSAMLLSAKDAARSMEVNIREPMKAFHYRAGKFAAKNAGGETAEGYGYEYRAQDIDMYGESYVVKYKKVLYYLNMYTRQETKTENLQVWDRILSSARWI